MSGRSVSTLKFNEVTVPELLSGPDCTGPKSSVSSSARLPSGSCLLLLCTLLLFQGQVLAFALATTADSAVAEVQPRADSTRIDSSGPVAAADSMVQRLSRTGGGQQPHPLDIPYQQPDSVFSVKNVSMVLIVMGLLVLFLHFLRKFLFKPLGGGISGEQFRVIRQFHLGPKKSVTLVRLADRLLLLGVTDSTITTLAEIDDPDEVSRIVEDAAGEGGEQGGGFKNIYQNLLSRGKKDA